jgi:hypothetical protein
MTDVDQGIRELSLSATSTDSPHSIQQAPSQRLNCEQIPPKNKKTGGRYRQ